MNEKEFNRAILAELAKVAKDYFNELSIPAGTYTASELANGKKGKEEIKMYAPDEIRKARHIVSVGSFRCEFTSESVFGLVYKFEKLSGVSQKDKIHFIRTDEQKDVICSFVADFGKNGMKWMVDQISKDYASPILCNAYLNLERSELVASDSRILSVSPLRISGFSGRIPDFPVLINAEMLKNLKGECTITVSMENKEAVVTAKDGNGKEYVNRWDTELVSMSNYPDYLKIIPNVSKELHAQLKKEDVKQITSLAKSAKKTYKRVLMDIKPYSRTVTVSMNDYSDITEMSIDVNMHELIGEEIHLAFDIDSFLKLKGWDGGIWFGQSHTSPVLFDTSVSNVTILMPNAYEDDKETYYYSGVMDINPFERICGNFKAEPVQVSTKTEKVPETPNIPAPYVVSEVSAISFSESLSALISFLFAFFLESETRKLLERLQYLAGIAGKPISEMVPELSRGEEAEPSARPVQVQDPSTASEPPGEPETKEPAEPARIASRAAFSAMRGALFARCRVSAPSWIHPAFTAQRHRLKCAKASPKVRKGIAIRASLSPPRILPFAEHFRETGEGSESPCRPPPDEWQLQLKTKN